jgi:AraC-like DNA-binding protein
MDNMIMQREDILTFQDLRKDGVLSMDIAGISYKDPTYRIRRDAQPLTVFEYVTEGSGVLIVDGKKYAVNAGCFYIAPSWLPHEYYSNTRDPWVKYWVNLSGPLLESLRKVYGIYNCYVFPDAEKAGGIMKHIIEQLPILPRSEILQFMECEMLRIVQALAESAAAGEEQSKYAPQTEAMLQFLHEHIFRPMPELQDIADAARRSKAQAIRIFRQDTGVTPYRWLLQEKIRTACSVLTGTNKRVCDVAMMFGFRDELYFSRLFRQITGYSPREYRKRG